MKELHIIVSVQVTDDEYSELKNPFGNLTLKSLLVVALENGSQALRLSSPLLLLDLPHK